MPYNRPALPDLAQTAENDLAGRLSAFGRLRRNVIKVVARVWAGLIHGVYGFIDYFSKQLMPYTATGQYLDDHASWWGIYRKPAARAKGRVVFYGTPDARVPAGIILVADSGRQYQVTEAGRVDGDGRVSLPVKALVAGGEADIAAGASLRLINPQTGIKPLAVADAGDVSGGAAEEVDGALRARLSDRVQAPPQGGTLEDYRQWAKAVPGVTRAWAYGSMYGAGTVGVTFVRDGSPDIIPNDTQVAEVQSWLDNPIRKPITADIIVYAPVARPVDVVIQALSPDTDQVRAAVTAELTALFVREAVPGGTVLISHVREVISGAAGEYDHKLLAPVDDIVPDRVTILVLGEVHFVD